jgi:hypothetical protein
MHSSNVDNDDMFEQMQSEAARKPAKGKAPDPLDAAAGSALPDASALWWQWYQGMWRICLCQFSRINGRWEFRWLNGEHWFRCHLGVFVRCEPPTWEPTEGAAKKP